MLDLSFDRRPTVNTGDLSGPVQILSGDGCRLTLKTLADESRRNDDLVARLYQAVVLLHQAGAGSIREIATDGHLRVYGGDTPFFVKGSTQREVLASIGREIIKARTDTQRAIAALGITALVEW